MDETLSASALALGRAIRAKRVSAAEVVDAYLQRIDQVNPAMQRIDERARAEARAADAALARGETGGPFHGVPFTAKDIFDVAGVVSAAGLVERANYVPDCDAVVVARMRGAGAILLGKTNCPPGGSGSSTENPVYGATRNPYDLGRSPSGSSSPVGLWWSAIRYASFGAAWRRVAACISRSHPSGRSATGTGRAPTARIESSAFG